MTLVQPHRFQVGTVLSKTFTAFFTRILPFSGFSLIGFFPTILFLVAYIYYLDKYIGFGTFPTSGEPAPQFDPDVFTNLPWGWITAAFIGFTAVSLITSAIWLTTTSFGAFQYLRGQSIEFIGSLQRGVSTALPAVAAMLLISLGFYGLFAAAFAWPFLSLLADIRESAAPPADIFQTVGQIFLAMTVVFIVVAVVFVRIVVTFPVIAVERPGVFAAFRRSWNLTRGNFWRIFGIGLVLVVALYAMSIPISILVIILTLAMGESGMWIGQGINIILSMAANAILAIAAAVIYVELRRAKEGFGIEDIAAVFD